MTFPRRQNPQGRRSSIITFHRGRTAFIPEPEFLLIPRYFENQCWFSKTDAGFRNPALDFQISCWFSKTNTGFQNPALDSQIPRWSPKTYTGFQNPTLVFEIARWFPKTNAKF